MNYVIESIYPNIETQNSFFVSYWKRGKRVHRHYQMPHLSFEDFGEFKRECSQILKIEGDSVYCTAYENSRWHFYKVSKNTEKLLKKFDPLEKIKITELNSKNLKILKNAWAKRGESGTETISLIQNLDSNEPQDNDQEYGGYKYLLPRYLLTNYYVGNVSRFGLETSMNDPLNRHVISLSLYYNWGINIDELPLSGGAFYTYSKNKWRFGGGYFKFYGQGAGRVNVYESTSLSVNRSGKWRNLPQNVGVSFSRNNEFDNLLSFSRNLNIFRFNYGTSYTTAKLSSFFRKTALNLGLSRVKNKDFKPYYSLDTNSFFNFRFSDNWSNSFNVKYKKLLGIEQISGSRFRDGVIYGGGVNSSLTGFFAFPSFHLGFQQLLGEEMVRMQYESSHRIWSPYKAYSFLNFYFKDIYLFGGAEYLKSDLLLKSVFNQTTQKYELKSHTKSEVISSYVGLRFNFDLLYLLPLTIEGYSSWTSNDLLEKNVRGLLLKSRLTF